MDWAAMVEDARKTPQLQTVGEGNQLLTRSLCKSERPRVDVDVGKGVRVNGAKKEQTHPDIIHQPAKELERDVDGAMGMDGQGQPWTGVVLSEFRLSDTTPSLKADKSKQELHRRCPLEAPKKKKK
ncbi:uncharacterized protein BO96DRAFT_466347 [Aspergillus niger CBS 101883]|uniref:Uncharacterized protein n=2 Tax=Aspergillus niger TaxID=5061 RepID=A2RBG4_ASPNC|nr:uncharacterized protein BO96DRAFT_466347 [Aspergillus niger CBS 101883]XP_059603004.1 hypothetical protein An18g06630 [Aspergillus niger]PYH56437.1 hypothetical protein BO96DRAFT_466347 [Aspergillus niger CBS 101883]CAK43370.1 hypothetical protein An18g06630 [Aspergillus niger]